MNQSVKPADLGEDGLPNVLNAAELEREIAVMERAIALAKRRDELRRQIEELGIDLQAAPQTMMAIAERVAVAYGLTMADIRGRRRDRDAAWPRQHLMWLLYRQLRADGTHRYSLPVIGRFLGGRDHTTILHGIGRHELRQLAKAQAENPHSTTPMSEGQS